MTDAQETAEDSSLRTTGGGPPDDVESAPIPLLEPREGIPPVVADETSLAEVIAAFAAGSGPVAVDAERASGYRYGQRAYLVQLRREGAGTALIDPVACPDLSGLGEAISGVEWVLHAATQDLPCLREIGMVPTRLFDTELAGRLAGFPEWAWARWSRACSASYWRRALRGRLVHAPAPGAVAALRRARRGTARRSARRPGEGARPAGQAGLGPTGVRRDRAGRARAAAQGPLAPYVRDAQGAPPSADGGRAGAVGGPGPDRPAPGHLAGQGAGDGAIVEAALSFRPTCTRLPR